MKYTDLLAEFLVQIDGESANYNVKGQTMQKRFTEEQIIKVLKEQESGHSTA